MMIAEIVVSYSSNVCFHQVTMLKDSTFMGIPAFICKYIIYPNTTSNLAYVVSEQIQRFVLSHFLFFVYKYIYMWM